jgi:preflagellin peptidase FlaK
MMIDIIRFSASTIMLLVASFLDLKYREISDLLWVVFGVLGLVLNGYEFFTGTLLLSNFLFSLVFILIIGFIIYYLQLLGEADIIAFITLAFLNPSYLSLNMFSFYIAPLFFSMSLFSNSVLSSASSVILNSYENLMKYFLDKSIFRDRAYSMREKIIFFFTAQKKSFTEIRGPPFDYPMEYLYEGNRKLLFRTQLQDDESAKKIFNELRGSGLKMVWVSSTLPFILYITVGYFVTCMVGDVMFLLLNHFF